MSVPDSWYNLLADFPLELPDDLPSPHAAGGLRPQLPAALIRQEMSRAREISIPGEVMDRYLRWRPTPLRRASALEAALDTPARIYFKYEGDNLSGSHKLNTAIPQAFYYAKAGAKRLSTGTGAGQWGTALALAGGMFGLETVAFMTRSSYDSKPYRRVIMEMLGCRVEPVEGNLADALAAALGETRNAEGTRFATGSGEGYSLLHQTVIGQEAASQLSDLGERPDVVIASLGAGSNFGGIAFPFLGAARRSGGGVRAVAVEPAACPKLTRGRYRYDFTDASRATPLQKMFTLGSGFATPPIHAGGLRYHATAKIISALRAEGAIEAAAYTQKEVFGSAVEFARLEGVLPAPEAAHAVHGAIREAIACREEGVGRTILFCLSGHGMYDLAAYDEFQSGRLDDVVPSDEEIERSLALLPEVVA
ncbi:TrpB-like pyridoxal phosphate-dependent enzyme [Actinocorallia sp. B10E7]|uniref:TrpB-like pyridoxal phosphate-dependent enzyme n=1 Tax=Actinocorallia sp. B10E7 TaxID=3153558 RepID=UPI00325CD175